MLSEKDAEFVNKITEEKRILNPWAMVNDTHQKGKAWGLVYRNGFGYKEVIPKKLDAYLKEVENIEIGKRVSLRLELK